MVYFPAWYCLHLSKQSHGFIIRWLLQSMALWTADIVKQWRIKAACFEAKLHSIKAQHVNPLRSDSGLMFVLLEVFKKLIQKKKKYFESCSFCLVPVLSDEITLVILFPWLHCVHMLYLNWDKRSERQWLSMGIPLRQEAWKHGFDITVWLKQRIHCCI